MNSLSQKIKSKEEVWCCLQKLKLVICILSIYFLFLIKLIFSVFQTVPSLPTVDLLSSHALDADILDEVAREELGLIEKNEYIIFD